MNQFNNLRAHPGERLAAVTRSSAAGTLRAAIATLVLAAAMVACGPPSHVEDASGVELTKEVAAARSTLDALGRGAVPDVAAASLERAMVGVDAARLALNRDDAERAALYLEVVRSEIAVIRSWQLRRRAEASLGKVTRDYEDTQRMVDSLRATAKQHDGQARQSGGE